jgi:hypothetical protein
MKFRLKKYWKHRNLQGCQIAYFHTKCAALGIFGRALEWIMFEYLYYGHFCNCTVIWNI